MRINVIKHFESRLCHVIEIDDDDFEHIVQ